MSGKRCGCVSVKTPHTPWRFFFIGLFLEYEIFVTSANGLRRNPLSFVIAPLQGYISQYL